MANCDGLVSVIIPAFNRVRYIEQTVRSVLTQDYSAVELLVVDDGSTDGTYEILQAYADRGEIVLLTHPGRQNKGQSASINLGLSRISGEFVAILDSDDLFAPGKLRKQVEFLMDNPKIGLVYGNGYAIDSEGRFLYEIHGGSHKEPNDPDAVLLDCYFLLPQNSLVRRHVYNKVGTFEEEFRAAQDHDMLIRMAEVTKFGYLPELVFYYRRHADSISAKGQELRWRNGFEILRRASARYPYRRDTLRKRAAVLNFRLGQELYRKSRFFSALFLFIKAGLLDPLRAVNVLLKGKSIW